MFRKITACATALTLTMVPSIQVNAEAQHISVNVNGQDQTLSLNATQGKEDEREILGDAWYYGVVADTFNFNGESETNFAVKSLKHVQGTGGQTGVTDKGAGSRKAFFMAGSVDAPFMVKGISAEVVTPESEKDKFQNSTNSGNAIAYTYENAEDINAYVDALENDVTVQSQRLSDLDSISDYTSLTNAGKITLDITSAGDSTVYINVDKWPELKNQLQQSSGVSVIKNAGQKAVFNFPSDSAVTLQKMSVTTNGKNEDTTGLANHSTATGSTATDLIFNMPVATSVSLNDSTGIFLAPKADVTCYGVDGGWLIADAFTNNCEWHFINGGLPAEITERKTVITPKREGSVLGARCPRPAVVTPTTEEKPVETPKSEEVTPAPSTTPEATPSSTPETKVTPAPESSRPEKEEKETKTVKETTVPSSTPAATAKTEKEADSSPKPVETPATEETKPSATPETSKPDPTPSSTTETKVTPVPESSTPAKDEKETKTEKETLVPASTPVATAKPEKETTSSPKPVETTKAEKQESSEKQVEKKEVGTVETKNGKPEEMKTEKVVNVPKKSSGHNPVHYAKQVKEAVPIEEKNAKAVRSETPDTADHSDMNIYSTLLITSGILMIGAIRRMRKEEE